MRKFRLIFYIVVLLTPFRFFGSLIPDSFAQSDSPRILWVPLEGTVELGLSPYIQRAISVAENEDYDYLVVEVETFGGRVDAAVQIRDALLKTNVKTVAWVNKRAISAGALISIACDQIFFSTGGSMGAATPIQMGGEGAKDAGKKFVSYMRGEMAATAEANGKDPKIAGAMVMAENDIEGLIEKGEVLTLTEKTALEFDFSEATVDSRDELINRLDLQNPKIVEFEINWAEKLVRFLTDPTVAGLLMSLAVLGLIIEFQAPGLGLPGLVSATAFFLYFGSKFFVHLAGWEEIILLFTGVVLIVVEVFLLPGFFVFALAGLACIVGALFLSGVSPQVPFFFELPEIQSQIYSVSLGIIFSSIGFLAILYFLMNTQNRLPLVFRGAVSSGEGIESAESDDRKSLIGQTGTAITDLRPSGKAAVGDRVYVVETDGGFLERGDELRVIKTDSNRILVRGVRSA